MEQQRCSCAPLVLYVNSGQPEACGGVCAQWSEGLCAPLEILLAD